MAEYKIAVATSDGVFIDRSFGGATEFDIYTVTEDGYELSEIRPVPVDLEEDRGRSEGCGSGHGCGPGCAGGGHSLKVEMLSDVRCLICSKIGFQAQKQFEKRAITTFDVSCGIDDALDKITGYFARVDQHRSLRGWQRS